LRKTAKNSQKQPSKWGSRQAGKHAKTLVKSGKKGGTGGVSGTDYKNNENNC
jgi:hypothetical protein